jgi:hypothetical protein
VSMAAAAPARATVALAVCGARDGACVEHRAAFRLC